MATYAIGDVQGCYDELQLLLEKIKFNPDVDKLWFAGDMINRGPKSFETLEFIISLKDKAICILGNHDINLLAQAYNIVDIKPKDTAAQILKAKNSEEIINWLRKQPLIHLDNKLNFLMVHAGIPHTLSIDEAMSINKKICSELRGDNFINILKNFFKAGPLKWSENLSENEKITYAINAFTRMRFCYNDGSLELKTKDNLSMTPKNTRPWFNFYNKNKLPINIVFGHWAAIQGKTEVENIYAIDTGCVWGGSLTALRLEDKKRFCINC